MSAGSDITVLYREFADALTEVLAENAVGPARRGRLARARAAVKHHPEYSESGYLRAVEAAFENWEAMSKGRSLARAALGLGASGVTRARCSKRANCCSH